MRQYRDDLGAYIAAASEDDVEFRVALAAVLARYEAATGVVTPGTLRRMPNQPKTPLKSFRIPKDLYEAAQAKAAERGESVSEVVRRALERYVRRT